MGGAPIDMGKIFPEAFKIKERIKTNKKKLSKEELSAIRVDMINRQHTRDMMSLSRMGVR